MIRCCLCLLLAIGTRPAQAQDYEREKRWADEIVPGVVVGDALWLDGVDGRKFLGLFTDTDKARAAILLVHGLGVHPDHGVIGALRTTLADSGYKTLSVQMPVLHAEASPREYRRLFADAVKRIGAASAWLRAKYDGRIVLLSHSMGSSMSNAFYEQTPDAPFAAWICMGLGGAFGNMRNAKAPVLDVFGERDLPSVLRDDWRRRITADSIPGSRQVRIPNADHFYSGHEKVLADVIDGFIREQVIR